MSQSLRRLTAVGALVVFSAVAVIADISRTSGPTTVVSWPVVLFDAAFDTTNQVYLVVWGPHSPGPARGQFLSATGSPVGSSFAVSDGAEWSGWARVTYSAAHQKFFIAYTKIVAPGAHQRTVRFATYNSGSPSLTPEIPVDTFAGAPGVDAGDVEYSPGADTFLVTWRESEPGVAFPESYIAAVSPAGAVGTRHLVSNPGDGQSDPRIACGDSGRCLVVGWAWGVLAGNTTSLWGRFVDGSDATPVGGSSFYVDSFPATTAGEVSVAFSPQTGNFFSAWTRGGNTIWGKTISPSGSLGTATLLKQSVNPAIDGGGYGFPNLVTNPASNTMLLTTGNWYGSACAQELSSAGVPIGATDCVPFPAQDNTGFNVGVADSVNTRFLMLDNENYNAIRATMYQATTSGGGTPTAPVIGAHPQSKSIPAGASTTLNVSASGTAPLSYQWYSGVAPSTSTPVGSSSSSYTTPTLTGTFNYWVRVTNAVGFADSNTATIVASGGGGSGGITRVSGPTSVVSWPMVLFDAAFDTVNQVYLVVWGPHAEEPARGQFLNASGAPIGAPFVLSSGSEWTGWARVAYSEAHQKFFVAYTKILGASSHQRTARFVTYNGGSPSLGAEIFIDTFAGAPGVDAGDVEYSPGANAFLVAWREAEPGRLPESFIAAVSPTGVVGTRHLLTNPADGQSDPRIACGDAGRCLVTGWAWGNLSGATSIWGRFVDGADATPVGGSSFYIDTAPFLTAGEVAVTFNPQTGNYFTASTRGGSSVWGKTVTPSGGLGTAFLLKSSVNPAIDGGGYGIPSLTYNAGTQTMFLGMANWFGTACAQELGAAGNPVGATDCVPFTAQDAAGFNTSVADPVNARFLLLDNFNYNTIRATLYQGTPVVGGGVAPTITSHPISQNIQAGAGANLSVTATGGSLTYQWYEGASGSTAQPIGGATASSYSTPALTGTKQYWVRVSNGAGSADSLTATVGVSVVLNGGFQSGLNNWQTFATPDPSYIVATTVEGAMRFHRVPPPAGQSNQATVFQHTGAAYAANTPLVAAFRLGNTSSARRRITVVVADADFSDLQACNFWLDPGQPLGTHLVKMRTTEAWSNASIYFYAASAGVEGGDYVVDDVAVWAQPGESLTRTDCVDPTTPGPGTASIGPNIVSNSTFAGNVFAPWNWFGSIVGQVSDEYVQFMSTPPGTPAAVIFQQTGVALPNNDLLTANLRLGNSSGVRKRVTVVLHDSNFSDLQACNFWIPPGQSLSNYTMRTFTTKGWANATISIYAATVGSDPWIFLDDVTMNRTPQAAINGTECLEPGSSLPPAFAAGSGAGGGSSRSMAPTFVFGVEAETPPAPTAAPTRAAQDAGNAGPGSQSPAEAGIGWEAVAAATGTQYRYIESAIDLRQNGRSVLSFESRLLAGRSAASIEVSTDGVTWQHVVAVPASDDWVPIDVSLAAWAGQIVQMRFVFDAMAPPVGFPPDVWQVRDVRVRR